MSKLVKMWTEFNMPDNEYSVVGHFIFDITSSIEDIKNNMSSYSESGIHRIILWSDKTNVEEACELTEEYFVKVRGVLKYAHELKMKVYIHHNIEKTIEESYKSEQRQAKIQLREICDLYYSNVGEYFGNTIIGIIAPDIKSNQNDKDIMDIIAWCDSHYIEFIGNEQSDTDSNISNYMRCHIPGQKVELHNDAELVENVHSARMQASNVMNVHNTRIKANVKLAPDVAKYLKKRRNFVQIYKRDNSNNIIKSEDIKACINYLISRGTNMFSLDVLCKEDIIKDDERYNVCDSLSESEITRITTYISRMSYLMTDSVNSAKVAVLCSDDKIPDDEIKCLSENQIEYNYLPVQLLQKCILGDNKRVNIGDYEYDTIVNLIGYDEKCLTGCYMIKSNEELQEYVETVYRPLITSSKHIRYTSIIKNGRKLHIIVNEGTKDEKVMLNIADNAAGIILEPWEEKATAQVLDEMITVKAMQCLVIIEFIANDREKINIAINEMNRKSKSIKIDEL